jgi:hypothetical protein
MAVLAGTDFFTVEILSWRGLVTYHVLYREPARPSFPPEGETGRGSSIFLAATGSSSLALRRW